MRRPTISASGTTKKSGTYNFWIERTTRDAFTPGARCRWGVFALEGEACTVCSDGPTLTATLRMGEENAVQIFRIPFKPTLDRRHLVTIGWSKGKIKVLLDAKLLVVVELPLPEPRRATEDAFALGTALLPFVLASLLAWFPWLAHAHHGGGHTGGLVHGFSHPFGGLDHLCAMMAVGLWAAQRGGRAQWLVPLTFVSVMAAGGVLGMAGVSLPFVEAGMVSSLLVLGVLIAAAIRLPLAASAALVGLFAVFHGHAHGSEMPANTSGLAYGAGFIGATALLHALGIGFARIITRLDPLPLVRLAGGAVALCGLYLSLR
jgi:urease accessory protein